MKRMKKVGKKMGRLIDVDEIPIDCDYYDVENAPTVEAIPKAEYEARLKADMVAMLDKIKAEIEARLCDVVSDYTDGYRTAIQGDLAILDKYKAESEET